MNSTPEVGHDPDQIARLLDGRPGRGPDRHPHLVCDHVGQRRLAQARWPVEQDVVQRVATLSRRGDSHVEVLAHSILSDVLVEHPRTKTGFILSLFVDARGCHEAIWLSHSPPL